MEMLKELSVNLLIYRSVKMTKFPPIVIIDSVLDDAELRCDFTGKTNKMGLILVFSIYFYSYPLSYPLIAFTIVLLSSIRLKCIY